MKKIGLVVKDDDRAQKKAKELKTELKNKCVIVDTLNLSNNQGVILDELLCIIVLGGDGTFLSAARFIADQDIPLLGVKFGEVGFLAEITQDSLFDVSKAIFKGKYIIKKRARLDVRVIRKNKEIVCASVLNDVVINKAALSRLASCSVYLDSIYLTTFRADGLIVATPTGSTAYSLAAGGPVVHPDVPSIIITPICPFTLTNRPLIIPDPIEIELKLNDNPKNMILTLDGQQGFEIDSQDKILVSKSSNDLKIISFENLNYFEILKTRLNWSGGRID